MVYFVIGLIFVLLILVHEYGHFLAAKKYGVEVEEFGIGFPPRITGKVMGKGIFRAFYTLNWLPFGGFVKMKGENEADKRKGSFGAASYPHKVMIIMAGVAMNLLTAMLILTVLAWVGMPQVIDDQFKVASDSKVVSSKVLAGYVADDSPAAEAGVEFGDELVSLNGQPIESSDNLFKLTDEYAGQKVKLVYKDRQNTVVEKEVQLRSDNDEGEGHFGVSPTDLRLERSTWSAPITGVVLTLQLAWKTIVGLLGVLGALFTGAASQASESITGPVGIFVLLKDMSVIGPQLLAFFVAVISLTLAVMNALPIPALDGGRLFVSGLFKLLKKPLSPKLENAIHGTGFVLLLGLLILVSINDIHRFF